ncbi:MAG: 2-oxoacid:ferredoxin oxidoreductase subunit beta, partial [Deltaproteobacteria bacterium]|nr:2-oxoacid:ferredoxin oxidoreductase subunit beta [Deltaproteobacteria bacterium]
MKTPGRVLAEKVAKIKEAGTFSVRSENLPTWCPGCGYFGIHQGLN